MKRKKLKITIELEGQPTQVIEANGIAAAILNDGDIKGKHKLSCLICGNMSVQDLINLQDGVDNNLSDAIASNIIKELPAKDLLKLLLGGKDNESEG